MKKILIIQSIIAFFAISAYAANPFDEFKNQITAQATEVAQLRLDAFTKDLGFLMGGASYHKGNTCGFPGFDVGVHVVAKSTSKDNAIVKAASLDALALPIAQVELGLPMKIDLIGRFASYQDAALVGGGLRYGIFNNSLPLMPNVSVQGTYTMLNVSALTNKFSAKNMSVSAMASFNVPIIDPYIGIGVDQTEVTADATITELKGKASSSRIEAGVNLTMFPFTYLQVGGVLANGEMGYTAGLGVKF